MSVKQLEIQKVTNKTPLGFAFLALVSTALNTFSSAPRRARTLTNSSNSIGIEFWTVFKSWISVLRCSKPKPETFPTESFLGGHLQRKIKLPLQACRMPDTEEIYLVSCMYFAVYLWLSPYLLPKYVYLMFCDILWSFWLLQTLTFQTQKAAGRCRKSPAFHSPGRFEEICMFQTWKFMTKPMTNILQMIKHSNFFHWMSPCHVHGSHPLHKRTSKYSSVLEFQLENLVFFETV